MVPAALFPFQGLLHLDFDVAASRQTEVHERVNRLGSWFKDIDEALVYAHLKLLATLLVDVRTLHDGECSPACRQWDWASKASAST